MDAEGAEARAEGILEGLQFTARMRHGMRTEQLSGGWKMRLALAQALFVPSDLLLLDEPTNHLDLHAVLWLADYLLTSAHTLVVVSHDRAFLDLCTDTVHFHHQRLDYHAGNFSAFESAQADKAARQAQILEASAKQRDKAEAFIAKQRASAGKKKGNDPNKQRQAKEKAAKLDRIGMHRDDGKRYKNMSLKKMDMGSARLAQKVHIEGDDPALKFKFPDPAFSPAMQGAGVALVQAGEMSFGFPAAAAEPLLEDVTLAIGAGSKIAVVGKNGAGKSTLLKLLTGELELLGSGLCCGSVTRHRDLRIAHVTQHHVEAMDVHAAEAVSAYMAARLREGGAATAALAGTETGVRSHLGAFGLGGSHASRLIGSLSGGERMRLAFATVMVLQPHLLVLDEPTNHLDMETLDALAGALARFGGAVLIVSHNQRFLTAFCNELWVVDGGKVLVEHSDEQSFAENFAKFRSETVAGTQGRRGQAQAKAAMSKQAARLAAGSSQRTGLF